MARRRIEAVSRTSRAVGAAFSPLTMIVLALVAVVAMAGLGVLSAYAPELKTGNDGGVHALSNSSVGYAGIVKLLRATGVPVTLSRGRVSVNASDSLLITTPPVGVNPDQVRDRIRPAPRRGRYRIENKPVASNGPTGIVAGDDFELPPTGGPVLVVLPKWSAVPEARKPGWVSTVGPVPEKAALEVLPERMRKDVGLTRGKTSGWVQLTRPSGQRIGRPVRIEALQTLSGKALAAPGWVPVLTDASGAVIVAMKGGTRTYVLSDPDLLNTQGIKSLAGAQTAVALLDLLRAEGSPVIFDLTLHGFQRTRSLLRLMLEPPLLGVTLLLAALAAFAGYQAVVRFGPAREADRTVALGKRALADNTAGLVRLARREHRMASPYALLIRAAVARAIGAPRTLSEVELDAFLDRVGVMTGASTRYSVLAESARTARTPHDLMKVATDLYRWKQELTRGRQ
jgi:hypothetical protein